MTTGMTVAERWWEIGRRVENGEMFSVAEWDVFGHFTLEVEEAAEAFHFPGAEDPRSKMYANTMSILAYFLALEAEDAATQDAEPYPPTADVVAEEEPIQTHTSASYPSVYPLAAPERRSSWNAKVADGLRKWAHWLEERF